jgi:hypothetical protein
MNTFLASSLFAKLTKANWVATWGCLISPEITGNLRSQLVTGPYWEKAVYNYSLVKLAFRFFKYKFVSFYTFLELLKNFKLYFYFKKSKILIMNNYLVCIYKLLGCRGLWVFCSSHVWFKPNLHKSVPWSRFRKYYFGWGIHKPFLRVQGWQSIRMRMLFKFEGLSLSEDL